MTYPSKTFIYRALIGTLVLIVILSVQTDWFKSLFKKKDKTLSIKTETVGGIVDKDSNGNGVPDWEERLWGLDPTVLYTNGVSNKEYIRQKKSSIGGIGDLGELNETDRLARELFALSAALGQSDEIDKETMQKIGSKLGESIQVDSIGNKYSFTSIRPATTSLESLRNYSTNVKKILAKYDENTADIDIIIDGLESGTYSNLEGLEETKKMYLSLASELAAVRTPLAIAQFHLDIINGMYGMAQSFTYLQQIEDNGIQGVAGIALYKSYALRFQVGLSNMENYLTEYGIL